MQSSAFDYFDLTGRAIAPQLGPSGGAWTNLLRTVYHCPGDQRVGAWSYGMNVYFELGPDDDYTGKPLTWRRLDQVPEPADTVIFAESATSADHIMAHFWMTAADAVDVASKRHRQKANYTFVDGHAQLLPFSQTFAPPQRDLWNPQP